MKRFLAALLVKLLLFTPAHAAWGPSPCAPVGAEADYAGLKPGDVMIPLPQRVYNASGSQCCWCSLETCARYLGVRQLYDLTGDHKGASGPREMTAVLERRGVKFVVRRTQAELREALRYKVPVAILIPGHACVLVGLDDESARLLSNNHQRREVQVCPRWKFDRLWSGWGVALYPPDGQMPEPTAYGASGPTPGGLYGGDCPCDGCPGCGCDCGCRPAELTAEAAHTIVETAVSVQQGNAGGSGTVIDYDAPSKTALVASAAHIFRNTGKARVSFKGAGKGPTDAWVIYLNRQTDVALLEASADWSPVVYTGLAAQDPEPGAKVYKLGYPAYAQGQLNIRTGVVKPHNGFLFEASVYVQSGDSGGGIFLADGSLCSVVTGYYGPSGRLDPTAMYGSGTAALRAALQKLRAHGGSPVWQTDCCQRPIDRGILPWNSPSPILPRNRPPADQASPGTMPPPKWRQPEAPPAPVAPPPPAPVPAPAPAPVPPPAVVDPTPAPVPTPTTPAPQQQTPAAGLVLLGLLAAHLVAILAAKGRQ